MDQSHVPMSTRNYVSLDTEVKTTHLLTLKMSRTFVSLSMINTSSFTLGSSDRTIDIVSNNNERRVLKYSMMAFCRPFTGTWRILVCPTSWSLYSTVQNKNFTQKCVTLKQS
jgi:hypothetical protein